MLRLPTSSPGRDVQCDQASGSRYRRRRPCAPPASTPSGWSLIRSVRGRWDLWALAELFALTGLAIAQPVLDVTGRSPDMFLFRRADRLDILALVAGLILLPALAIWLLEVLAGLVSGTARRLLHLAAVTGLLVVAVEVVKATTGLRGPGLAAVAAAAGLGGGVVYASLSWPRLWLRFLAPAPVVFALLFLLASPTSALVLPARAATAPVPPVAGATRELPPVVMILLDEFPLRSLLDAASTPTSPPSPTSRHGTATPAGWPGSRRGRCRRC